MVSNGPAKESPPILFRVPSNVVNAATADVTPDAVPNEKNDKLHSETESNENSQPEFKEGGYGW
jgi:hypothetical protein